MKKTAAEEPVPALMGFITRMNEWEKRCIKANAFHRGVLGAVFRDCCSPKAQGEVRLKAPFFNDPPDYDPAREKVLEIVHDTRNRVRIRTSAFKGEFPSEYRYLLRLLGGRWLVEAKQTIRQGKTIKALL